MRNSDCGAPFAFVILKLDDQRLAMTSLRS
jgi:hypothetical protein